MLFVQFVVQFVHLSLSLFEGSFSGRCDLI